jgi:hypothetical protein
VRSGNGYFIKFENEMPLLGSEWDMARRFMDISLAEAAVNKIMGMGFEAEVVILRRATFEHPG